MNPGNPFILGSKGQRSRSVGTNFDYRFLTCAIFFINFTILLQPFCKCTKLHNSAQVLHISDDIILSYFQKL